jgi:hypothetical protein
LVEDARLEPSGLKCGLREPAIRRELRHQSAVEPKLGPHRKVPFISDIDRIIVGRAVDTVRVNELPLRVDIAKVVDGHGSRSIGTDSYSIAIRRIPDLSAATRFTR